MSAVDLFAGPGGWDVAARRLGLDPTGFELDDAACSTRRAAGLATVQGDVSQIDPLPYAGVDGLIASPPCPTFSPSGKGSGRRNLDDLLAALPDVAAGRVPDLSAIEDPRTELVLEPLRWIVATRPRWVALEQVPPVLPVWRAMGRALRELGYHGMSGVLDAVDYGVPQSRRRAILVGALDDSPKLPIRTHVDPVSMAEAIGWDPRDMVGFPRRDDGQRSVILSGIAYRARDLRPAGEPAFTLTEKARSWQRWTVSGTVERIEIQEATQLQTFPIEHPWQGSRTQCFHQIGNAVPPLLAERVLEAVIG